MTLVPKINEMNLLEALNWRYATKKMNGTSVPQEKVNQIIEAARLAPTSSGLQPFRIIEVSSPEWKAKIKPVANGQTQITDASHVLIFAAWDTYTEDRIRAVFRNSNMERGLADDIPSAFELKMRETFLTKTDEENFAHTARQAYIGFGFAIAQAALLKVDASPMEGFVNDELDELLGLKALGLRSVTILALGHRDVETDWLLKLKKVRTPAKEFLIKLK